MPHNFTFVALDLETTGLSYEKDTIIEVAAIKFYLEKEGDIFTAVKQEERSMLIDPERTIDEHISMITGISNEMVQGKSKWHEVRERVASFIGDDSIIVGHNVLFDVRMLEAHGIHIGNHQILDTFELSELFSGDAESLNLGFLAKKYGYDDGSEHRALDDTKLSIKLFLHYLRDVSRLTGYLISLWEYARNRDESGTINTLLTLIENHNFQDSWEHPILNSTYEKKEIQKNSSIGDQYILKSLPPFWEDEKSLIDSCLHNGKVLILTPSKKQSYWLKEKLSSAYPVSIIREKDSYISLRMIKAWVDKMKWKRKETILIIRLIHWLFITKTGNIDEIKWYGDEGAYKYLFGLKKNEMCFFLDQDRKDQRDSKILIAEVFNKDLKEDGVEYTIGTCIIRDVIESENSFSYRDKKIIDWSQIEKAIDELSYIKGTSKDYLIYGLSIIEEIIKSVVVRPTGPNPLPPGEYGETYFFTQKEFWHKGYIWLVWASEKLSEFLVQSESQKNHLSLIEECINERLKGMLKELIRFIYVGDPHINGILEIKNQTSVLTLYSRDRKDALGKLIDKQGGMTNIITGYHIEVPSIQQYLQRECSLDTSTLLEEKSGVKISEYREDIVLEGEKVVILGTNLKSLRALSMAIKLKNEDYSILTQGISGGKSKIQHLFLQGGKSILIGLIDTWKDESSLWERVDCLCVTKVPFDPPNDPIYLARTVGISNNFENYSIPMAIQTLNTLIGRAKSANRDIRIFLTDEKLKSMSWGRSIFPDLL